MLAPLDYKDLLRTLNRHKAKYLIIGAYAVAYYAEPRYTKDLDVWVDPEIENAKRVYTALKEFGAPLRGISFKDFTRRTLVYQIGVEPVRVDIIMGVAGIDFSMAWKHRRIIKLDNSKVNIIGINELIDSKKKANRRTDLVDLANLRRKQKAR
ncbi:MAG: hypothetical protein Q8N80_03815 [Candidatus Omnitrophota bacterium]|nr:hypothetical protein [Candidatus Omnitrophota bacterium]